MTAVAICFPHQLFEESPINLKELPVYLVEECLFFKQYKFHKQKMVFHRASMKSYERYLLQLGIDVQYIDAQLPLSDIRLLIEVLAKQGVNTIHCVDPTDNWLEKRMRSICSLHRIDLVFYESPLFLNSKNDLVPFFKSGKKKFFQTQFYISERKKRRILMNNQGEPVGGKWSFDSENRKKYPRNKQPPKVSLPPPGEIYKEALSHVQKFYSDNPGDLGDSPLYPYDFQMTELWLENFLSTRFHDFGSYEDAIVSGESILNHSVLTPMMNVGLISSKKIIDRTLQYTEEQEIPINSTEGFIRQIIGWREFIRGIYECAGSRQRTTNFWNFNRKIPSSFYTGETGIDPVDDTIQKVLKSGYCHHIERLMILGNFMILCEFDPDEVYRWFMELFIDAYDWVMVPNIYGMSQFADGGLMATKPYISGSNYILKMSDYKKSEWQVIWDGLFWRFMHVHRDFFLQNPRLGMLVRTFDKMDQKKKSNLLEVANQYLLKLH